MAQQEQDREDLLAEATALVERVELRVADFPATLVVGFRREGATSFYFGADPAFHFNSAGLLRRAFVSGLLYKAERGRIVSLDRRRTAGEVQLVRHELAADENRSFLAALLANLQALREALEQGRFERLRQEPEQADVVGRVRDWLGAHGQHIGIAFSPRVG